MKKALFLLVLLMPFGVSAQSFQFEWEQLFFGSGIKSTFALAPDEIVTTGGVYSHLFTVNVDNDTPPQENITFINRQLGDATYNISNLNANTRYFITKGSTPNLNVIVGNNHIGQIVNYLPPSFSIYPMAPELMGFIYFETDSANEIECFSFALGRFNPQGVANFQACELDFGNIFGFPTALEALGYVQTGVQTTLPQALPVAGVVAGVPIAFIIGRRLIQFITRAV